MKQTFVAGLLAIKRFYLERKKLILGLFAGLGIAGVTLVAGISLFIGSYGKYVLQADDARRTTVGLVLGAGVAQNGKPFRELQARLDVAAQALAEGRVDKLILSGDNRFKGYNEPAAMVKYLVQAKNVPKSQLQPDYAGRSTYESCERAAKVFGQSEVIIFSAGSHLPRAIFLCRHFGIEAYGISSGVEANNSGRRELMAGAKALYNTYIRGEKTILGPPVRL